MIARLSPQMQGHFAMLMFSGLVAGSFSLGSLAANQIAPSALNAVRFAIATVPIGLIALSTGGFSRAALAAPWRYLVLGGLFAAYFVLMFEGLKTAPPVSTSAVFTLTPLITAVFGWWLLRQVTTPRMAVALAIGAAGALWVIFRADLGALLSLQVGRGETIYFAGCVAHALYTPMLRRLNRGERGLEYVFWMMVAGFLCLMFWGWRAIIATPWTDLPAIVWVTILYVSLAASAATFMLLQYAGQRLPSAKVMAYTYLTPTWVIVWEAALGHGVPPVLVLGGVAMTVMALWLLLKDEG